MAVDMFIKIGDIKGEASDAKHKDEIEILSWNWGATQTGSAHSGGGASAGKVNIQDLTLHKMVDKASAVLLKYCCSGNHIDKAVLVTRKAGGDKPIEYVTITMEKVIITSVNISGSGGEMLNETVSLNFSKVKFDYTPQNAKGGADGTVTMGIDVSTNTVS